MTRADDRTPETARSAPDWVLRADNISFGYAAREETDILRGVSVEARAGRLIMVVGPNGAGKSTLLRVLAGLLEPTRGRVLIALDQGPVSLIDRPVAERARHVAYVPQASTLAFGYTARAVLEMGRFAIGGDTAIIDDQLQRFQLTDVADRPFQELSAGQQQRVSLARAFAQLARKGSSHSGSSHSGRVLLADEPFATMDPKHALASLSAIREFSTAGGAAVVVVHDLTIAERADQLILLAADGTVAAAGPTRDVLTAEALASLYGTRFARLQGAGGTGAFVAAD
jgi:iron complex transport system ATP-binding protein